MSCPHRYWYDSASVPGISGTLHARAANDVDTCLALQRNVVRAERNSRPVAFGGRTRRLDEGVPQSDPTHHRRARRRRAQPGDAESSPSFHRFDRRVRSSLSPEPVGYAGSPPVRRSQSVQSETPSAEHLPPALANRLAADLLRRVPEAGGDGGAPRSLDAPALPVRHTRRTAAQQQYSSVVRS